MAPAKVLRNATVVNTSVEGGYDFERNVTLILKDGEIKAIVDDQGLIEALSDSPIEAEIDCQGRIVTPGLIDCHSHLIYGGNRIDEFNARMAGATYAEIALGGGGIKQTVEMTRSASFDDLYEGAKARMKTMASYGLTTLEIKSGYGLEFETEKKMLSVARKLDGYLGITITSTYLGAHSIPKEFEGDAGGYLDQILNHDLPEMIALGLCDAVDIFCESIAFDTLATKQLLGAAKSLGVGVKAHVEQLTSTDGTAVVVDLGGLSVDHLEYISDESIAKLANSKTVAVVLPGAYYFLREKKAPPVDKLIKNKIPIAIATDHNPGTSPLYSLLLAMNMSAVLFGLTPSYALRSTTKNAAMALGFRDRGEIAPGLRGDLAIWDLEDPNELTYQIGGSPLWGRVANGEIYV
jgi:imidazolonepropionase